jgi:hypothetical protein
MSRRAIIGEENDQNSEEEETAEQSFIGIVGDNPAMTKLAMEVGLLAEDGGIPSMRKKGAKGEGNKRSASPYDDDEGPATKKKKGGSKSSKAAAAAAIDAQGAGKDANKTSKGLRHFSMKVCEKVREKGRTTYNEVADELVEEFATLKDVDLDMGGKGYDEKNIRRRVYDALNVLMAMDIIAKVKKDIMWKGLPSNAGQELGALLEEKETRLKNIEKKKEMLGELLTQQIVLKNLVNRNSGKVAVPDDQRIPLPFIIVSTEQDTLVHCEMGEERTDISFKFNKVSCALSHHCPILNSVWSPNTIVCSIPIPSPPLSPTYPPSPAT